MILSDDKLFYCVIKLLQYLIVTRVDGSIIGKFTVYNNLDIFQILAIFFGMAHITFNFFGGCFEL